MRFLLCLFVLLLSVSLPVTAAPTNVFLPAATEGGTSSASVFNSAARTMQWSLAASSLGSLPPGTTIRSIAFRLNGGATANEPAFPLAFSSWDLQISRPPSVTLSTTVADNMGTGVVTVRSGPLMVPAQSFLGNGTSPAQLGFIIEFSTPYLYNGGDLLFTLRHTGNGVGTINYDGSASSNSRRANAAVGFTATTHSNVTTVIPTMILNAGPDITVFNGALESSPEIADDQVTAISFGSVVEGTTVSRTFLIKNDGLLPLSLTGATVPSGFTITPTFPAQTLNPGATTTLGVRCNSPSVATWTGNVVISNNDPDEAPFAFPITATTLNTTPTATAQTVVTNEDNSVPITLSGTDPNSGQTLTFAVVSGPNPSRGVLSGTPPNLTYTPNLNFFGNDSFTFTANDGLATSISATVSIRVTAVNDAPIANDQSVTATEDTPKSITMTGSDVDSVGLTFSIGTGPSHGQLTGTGATRTYTPAPNYNGPDSFTFVASDGLLPSIPATVSINVGGVNDPPVLANPISDRTTTAGSPFSFTFAANTFADVDAAVLTYTTSLLPSWLTFTPATRTFSGTPRAADVGQTQIVLFATDDGVPVRSASTSFFLNVIAPEIAIYEGTGNAGTQRTDNVGTFDFGSRNASTAATFTIQNQGTSPLTVSGVTSSSTSFVVSNPPAAPLAPNATHTFTVTMNTSVQGTRTALLSVLSDDETESIFEIPLTGFIDSVAPTVTINQASGQPDPTSSTPVRFDVVFSEPVNGFSAADLSFTGSTAPGSYVAVITGTGATYRVNLTGITGSGTVAASVNAGAVVDALNNASTVSTSTDRTVTYAAPVPGFSPVVSLDDTPPGAAPGTKFVTFYDAYINNAGRVIFSAQLGPVGSIPVAQSEGAWTTGSNGILDLIVRAGDPIGGGQTVSRVFTFPRIADNGTSIVQTVITGAGPVHTSQWIDNGTDTVTEFAQRTSLFSTTPPNHAFGGFTYTSQNQATGEGYFASELVQGGSITLANDSGVWKVVPSGAVTPVVREGEVLPEAAFGPGLIQGQVRRVAMGPGDFGVFNGYVVGTGSVSANAEVVCKRNFRTGEPSILLARANGAAPNLPGLRYFNFIGETINSAGSSLIWAQITGTGATSLNNRALFSDRNGTMQLILRYEDLLPPFGAGVRLNSLLAYWLLEDGSIVVHGTLKGTGVTGNNDLFAMRIDPAGTLTKIVREGDPVSVAGGASLETLQGLDVSAGGQVAILAALRPGTGVPLITGADNQILMRTTVTDPSTVISVLRKGALVTGKTVFSIALSRETVQGSTGSTGGMSRLVTENGQVCAIMVFNDNGMGVFVGL